MNETLLPAGKYVLVRLEDADYLTRSNAVKNALYIDVSGPDAQWVVDVLFTPPQMKHEKLESGTYRCTYPTNKPKLRYETQIAGAKTSLHAHQKEASFVLQSGHWVGSAFDGSEKHGLILATDGGAHNKQALVFEAAKDLKIDVSTNAKGITGLNIGTVAEKKPASRKRNAKGHFEETGEAASAK